MFVIIPWCHDCFVLVATVSAVRIDRYLCNCMFFVLGIRRMVDQCSSASGDRYLNGTPFIIIVALFGKGVPGTNATFAVLSLLIDNTSTRCRINAVHTSPIVGIIYLPLEILLVYLLCTTCAIATMYAVSTLSDGIVEF